MLITRYTPWLTRSINVVAIIAMLFSMVPVTAASSSAGVAIHYRLTEAGKVSTPRYVREAPRSRTPLTVQPDINDRPLENGVSITATKRDSLLVDNDTDNKADPGDVLLYTVVISNTGSTATGVVFTDTIDNNTTLVPGSVKTTPLALNDTYTATGNVAITVTVASAGSNLLTNDSDPDGSGAVVVSSFDTTSAQGGNVTVAANGDFSYDPPAGYEGVDTFTYTVQDVDGNTDTGTVTITISEMIWFINNNLGACASSCNGRLTHPFTSLGAFNAINNGAGNNPAAGDNIFLYESLGDYTGGVTLLPDQKLIGQDSTSTLAALAGVTPPSYSRPLPTMNSGAPITNITSGGNGVALASNNYLYGFTAGNASAVAITGTNFITLTVNEVAINNANSSALVLDTGTATATFNSTTSAGGSSNVRLTAVAGNLALGSGSLSGSSGAGAAFRINNSGSTATVTYSGTISQANGNRIVDIANHSTGTVTLSGNLSCTGTCTGLNVSSNSSGTVVFSGGTKTLNTSTNTAVNLSSNTGATINFTSGGLDIDTTSGTGFNATGGGTINVTGAGNTINTTTGQAVVMNGVTVGSSNITFATIGVGGDASSLEALSFTNVGGSGNTFNGGTVTVARTTTIGPIHDGIEIIGSAATFSFSSATIDNTTGAGINLSGANGPVTFTTVDIDGTVGAGIEVFTNTNTINVNGGTIGATDDPAGNVMDISAGSANVTIAATLTKSTAGRIVEITGRTSTSTIDITGSLNCSSTCTGINVQNNNTSGTTTINFSNGTKNLSTGTSAAVTLDNNDNATINFSNGGLNIDTTSGIGFNAINGAVSVNVTTGANPNTIDSTTGIALNVANTTIGASGLTFRSISANGASNGILLNTTGSSGGLTVSGTGSAGTGGTIQNATASGVFLSSTSSVNLSYMNIQTNNEDGIEGSSVTGLNLTGVNVTNNGDDSEDVGIGIDNLWGTAAWSNVSVTQSELANVMIDNTSGTLNSWTVSGTSHFDSLGTAFGGNSILVNIHGTAVMTAGNINGATFQNNKPARGITIQAQDTAQIGDLSPGTTNFFVVQNSTFTNNGLHASFEQAHSANLYFKFMNNGTALAPMTMPNTPVGTSHAVNVSSSSTTTGGTIRGRIQGNYIGDNAVAGSGSAIGNGLRVFIQGKTAATLVIDSNVIRQTPQARGMDLQFVGQLTASQPIVQSDLTLTNNDVNPSDTTGFPAAAIVVSADNQGSPARVRANVTGNTVPTYAVTGDYMDAHLILANVAAGAEMQLVDTTSPISGSCATELAGTNTGDTGVLSTCSLIAGPITTARNNGGHIHLALSHDQIKTNPPHWAQAANTTTVMSGSAKLFKRTVSANLDNASANISVEPVANTPAQGLFTPANSPLFSGENISITIGTLPANEVITITFAVTITNPLDSPPTATTVSNQGHVSWDAPGSIVTDDPDTGTVGDPTVTTLDLQADLALTKSDGGITVQPGNLFTYTLVYTNTGPNPAPNVTITETVPTNTTYTNTGAGWSCSPNNNPGSLCTKNVGSLAMSSSGSITFTLTVTNPVPAGVTTITNTATIGSGIPDPDSSDNTGVDTTPVNAQPDFQLSKTDGGVSAVPLGIITYTLTYTNTGNQDATGVVITETVPAHTTYTGSLLEWNCPSGPGPGQPCGKTIGALAGGGVTGTLLFTVTVVAGGEPPIPAGVDTLTNTAIITDDVTNGVDLTPGNNTAVDTTPLNAQPDFTLNKNDGGVTAVPDQVVTYTLSYANLGNQSATGVVLTETVPANTTFAGSGWTGCTSGSPGGTVCTKSIGALPGSGLGSGTAVFVITVTNPITAGVISITNTAQIGDDGSNGADPTPASNTATDSTAITAAPDLQLTKSDGGIHGTPGSVIQYTLTFTNTGNQGATGIVLSDTVPANSKFKPASSNPDWVCSPDNNPGSTCVITLTSSLAGGNATSVITFALQVDNPFPLSEPSITNTASITDDGTNGADATPANNTSTDVTPIDNLPDLKLMKSDGDISVPPGGTITYTLTYENLGGLAAPNAIISDTVPQYTTFAGSGWTGCSLGSPAGTVCTKSIGTVPGQGSGVVTFTVKVENPITTGVDQIHNEAEINDDGSNGADPNDGNNYAMDNTPVDAAPDLVLTKSDGGVTVEPGDTITYTLNYNNSSGTQGATGVVITETVPANTTFTGTGWSCTPNNNAGSTCTKSIGSLDIGDSGSVKFVVTVNNTVPAGVTTITNTATIGDDGDNGEDLDNGDNADTETTPLTAAPDLQVTKDDGGITVVPGDTITYTVTFANTGNQEATNVVITETVPANTTYTGGTWTCTPNNNASSTCTFSIGDLDAGFGGSEIFVVTTAISMPAGVNFISNTVSIGDDGTQGTDQNPGDNTDTDTTPVTAAPDLQITKSDGGITATAGQAITYTLTYTNTGNQGATGVVITETVPTNTTFIGTGWTCVSSTCTKSVGALAAAAGGSTTFIVTVASSVPAGVTSITNTVTIGNDNTNGADPNTGDNTAVVVTPLNAAPDLKVVKSDGGVTRTAGQTITYTVTYTNTGSQGATGVVLTETVPANTSFSGAGWSCTPDNSAGSTCTRSVGGLAAGISGSTSFVVTIASALPSGVTTITNTVSIGDDGANGADLNTTDNTSTDTTPVTAAPDLKITKNPSVVNAVPGSYIAYTLYYTNTGTQDAVGVVITDVVPANTTFNSSDQPTNCLLNAPAGTVCIFTFPSVNVGSSGSINYTVHVDLSTPANVTTITNTATIGDDGSQGADLNPANNSSTNIFVLKRPNLSLTKDDGGATAAPGATISYLLTYSNIGTWQSDNVVITETVPANTTFNAGASSSPWSCAPSAPAGSVCTFSIGTVLTSTGGTRTFAVTINNPLPPGVTTITNTATIGDNGTYGLDNNPSNNTATEVTASLTRIYMPLVMNNYAEGPDLVVTQLLASSNAITVTIKNIGTAATAASFWVDVYINPSAAPTHVNQTWSSLGTRGAVWGVTTAIAPNGVLTLTLGGPYYSVANSNVGGALTPGTPVYAQVDSVDMSTSYGAVLENHEITGGAYNNITGPTSSVLSLGAQATTTTLSPSAPNTSGLPPLPPREPPRNSQQVIRRRP